mgnify:CR=1 FL=1
MSYNESELYCVPSALQGERISLYNLATWKNGLPFKKIDFSDRGKPIIKIAELNGGITSSTSFTEHEYSKDVFLTKGDLVFSWSGNPDTSIDVYRYSLPDGWLNQHIFKVTANNTVVSADYLYYILKFLKPNFSMIAKNKQTTGLGHVTISDLQRLTVIVPSLQYQEKVSGILKALDDKIGNNKAINHNLQQQAASVFREWLNACVDYTTIGDISHNILDYTPVGNEKVHLLNSSDITEGIFPVTPFVPNKDLKGHFKKRFKFGDILYSEIRPRNHHYGIVLFDASDYIASTRLMVIRAIDNKVTPSMLYQYLLLPEVEAEFTARTESRSGTFPQGNYADLASIRVPYSPTDQMTVSKILSQIRYTIAHNQLESQRLEDLRNILLPKLMSGEIDVSEVEI